jgi:hypothetical protein
VDGLTCDRCGKALLADEPVRYVAELKIYAAYDPLELTAADLAEDHRAEIERLVKAIERSDPERLEDDVARALKLDLCASCQRVFLKDPLGTAAPSADSLVRAIERARRALEAAAGPGAARDLAVHATEIALELESFVDALRAALKDPRPAAIAAVARRFGRSSVDHIRAHAGEIERRFAPGEAGDAAVP